MGKSSATRQSVTARLFLAAALVGTVTTAWRPVPANADAPMTYQTGQSIEVREGDSWSAASVVQHEGRKYLVHYAGADASTDEWVGTDRMRLPGTPGTPVAPGGAIPQPTPPPARGMHHSTPGDIFPEPAEVIPQTQADRSAVEVGQPAEAPAAWAVSPDPVAKPVALQAWKLRTKSIDDQMSVKQLLPCSGGGGAILGFADFFDKSRRVERVGTTAPPVQASLPPQSLPLAASPSGGLLVCQCSAFGFGNNARIDAYTLPAGASAAVPLVSFTPYPPESGNGKAEDIRFAAALSDTRIVTCDLKGRLIAWDISAHSVTGIWRIDLGAMHFGGFGVNVVLSPGGKWLAAASKGAITFVDTANGNILGVIATPSDEPVFDLACSPGSKTLMARGAESLIGFDITTGKPLRTVAQPTNGLGKMTCPDDGFALIEARTLVDAKTGAVIPQYQPTDDAKLAMTGPGVTLLASDEKLSAVHLPDPVIRSAVAAAGDSALAIKPGMPIKLDIQLDMSDQDKADVDASIRKKLVDDGFVISEQADTSVVCRTEPGEKHEYIYSKARGFGMPMFVVPGGGGTSVILTDKITRLTIEQKGLTIWERKRDEGPSNRIMMKEGQSIEDAARASIHYDPKFLIGLSIPPYIAMPQAATAAPKDHHQHHPQPEQPEQKPV